MINNVNNIKYAKLLGFYLFSLVFFYPYGVSFGGSSLRFSDLVAIILITIGLLSILKSKKLSSKITLLWFIFPFLLFEIFFHLIGVIQYPNVSIDSSLRVLILYLPFLFIFTNFNYESFLVLEKSFEKFLILSLLITFFYSLIQVSVLYGFINEVFLFQRYLYPFAVDAHFNITDGMRVSGFFNNGIGLSIFGVASYSYFLAKALFIFKKTYIVYTIISLLLILLSATRVAFLVAILILLIDIFAIPSKLKDKLKILLNLSSMSVISLLLINLTLGTEQFFLRFSRLGQGLENDYSFNYRVDYLWPNALKAVDELPFGTLVQPFNVIGLIDSGYLSYYAQGKWLFLSAMLLFLIGNLVYTLITYKTSKNKWKNIFLLNFSVYLLIEAVTHNPMRNALILFFIFYGLISVYYSSKKISYI